MNGITVTDLPALTTLAVAGALLALPTARPTRRLQLTSARRAQLPVPWAVSTLALILGLWLGAPPIIAGGIGAWAIGKAVARQRAGRRRRESEDQLAEIVDLAAADMRAGSAPAHALVAAATDVGGPVGQRLALAARQVQWGDAKAAFATDSDAVDLGRVQHLWGLATTHGLPLGELFQQLNEDLFARHNHRERLMASLAGPRTTMWILAALPLFGIAMGQMMGTQTLSFLLFDGLGSAIFIVGVMFMSAGLLWAVHLTESAGELG